MLQYVDLNPLPNFYRQIEAWSLCEVAFLCLPDVTQLAIVDASEDYHSCPV
jgi:hypothetical protein